MSISTLALFTGWPILGSIGLGLSGPSSSSYYSLTEGGREIMARALVEGLAFRLLDVAYGSGGYNVSDPTKALPVVTTSTTLDDEQFREPFSLVNVLPGGTSDYYYRLDKNELTGTRIGEIGMYAQITRSPLFPAEVGTWVLYALIHTPLQVQGRNRVLTGKISLSL